MSQNGGPFHLMNDGCHCLGKVQGKVLLQRHLGRVLCGKLCTARLPGELDILVKDETEALISSNTDVVGKVYSRHLWMTTFRMYQRSVGSCNLRPEIEE